jgi:hypothetical protein
VTQTLGNLATRTARAQEPAAPKITLILTPPAFAQLPKKTPERGLLLSTLLHGCALAALVWLPLFMPVKIVPLVSKPFDVADLETIPYPDLKPLPALGDTGAKAGSSPSSPSAASAKPAPAAKPSKESERPALAQFAGPQEIVSDPPDATNSIQTIRRPDIVKPMKIKNPVRLRSMVQVPAPPVIKVKAAPPDWLTHPTVQPLPPAPAEITTHAPPVEKPAVLVVRRSEAKPRIIEVAPPSVMPDAKNTAPVLSAAAGNAPTLAKAAVVINAVEVPADPKVTIPDGEISGRFAVAPLTASVRPPDASGSGTSDHAGSRSGTGDGAAVGTNPNGGPTGSGTLLAKEEGGSGSGAGKAGVGNSAGAGTGVKAGAGAGTGNGTGSGAGNATGAGSGTGIHIGSGSGGNGGVGNGRGGGMTGISIAGAAGGGGGSIHTATGASRSYGLTVISAGNNGGPAHDFGAFSRNETVYTVYIPMRDVGGGADWSMQYALADVPNSKGLLTPPFATKKLKATRRPGDDPGSDLTPVFVAGIIDANGKLEALRPARASDARAQSAIAVLAEWQFTPAKLDGQPVAAKVLIGVMLLPATATTRGTQ